MKRFSAVGEGSRDDVCRGGYKVKDQSLKIVGICDGFK